MRNITYWLSLATIFVIPWENIVTIAGLGTVSKAIGFLVAGFWIFTVAITGQVRKPKLFHIVVLLFALWNGLSLLWTVDYGLTASRVVTYLQLFILVYIFWDVYTTKEALRAALQTYIFGAYITIISILQNFETASLESNERLSASGFNANAAAIILALGIGVAWYLVSDQDHSQKIVWLKWLNFAYIPLALLCILLAVSRSALMGAFPSLVFIFVSLKSFKPSTRIFVFVLLVGIAFALGPFMGTSVDRFVGSEVGLSAQDLNGRDDIWRKGMEIFFKYPLLGAGSGAFRAASFEKGTAAHSFVIGILGELGVVGLMLFLTIIGLAFYHARQQPKLLSGLWIAVLTGWILAAITQNFEHRKQTWLFFGLPTIGAGLLRREEQSSSPSLSSNPYLQSAQLTPRKSPHLPPKYDS